MPLPAPFAVLPCWVDRAPLSFRLDLHALDVGVTTTKEIPMNHATPAKKGPTHHAFMVRNYENAEGQEDASWQRIGAVWTHRDGDGFDIVLEAFPITGRVVIRKIKPRD